MACSWLPKSDSRLRAAHALPPSRRRTAKLTRRHPHKRRQVAPAEGRAGPLKLIPACLVILLRMQRPSLANGKAQQHIHHGSFRQPQHAPAMHHSARVRLQVLPDHRLQLAHQLRLLRARYLVSLALRLFFKGMPCVLQALAGGSPEYCVALLPAGERPSSLWCQATL